MRRFFAVLSVWAFTVLTSFTVVDANDELGGILDPGVRPSPTQQKAVERSRAVQEIATTSIAGSITFDEYTVNTLITNQYESLGVVFAQSFIELDNLPNPVYLSGDNEFYPDPYGNGVNAAPITANFLAPTNFVEADPIYLDEGSIMTINVLDHNGTRIGSVSGLGRLRVDANGITKAVFSFSNPNLSDDIAGIDNLAFNPAPLVSIDSADLAANSISVTLSGLGSSTPGPLNIELIGVTNTFQTSFNNGASVGDGTHLVTLDRPSIPEDTYTKIIATWKLSTGDVISQDHLITPVWRVLGVVRHSQYNTPVEATCTGQTKTAWVFDSGCNFTETTLDSKFARQVYINGTGRSIEHNIIKYSTTCSSSYPRGANARNAFLLVNEVTGSCNKAMTNTYQAAYPNPTIAVTPKCGDNTVLVEDNNSNKAEKEIQDYCPACKRGHHIDNYTDVEACSGGAVGDLGDFWTANLGAN